MTLEEIRVGWIAGLFLPLFYASSDVEVSAGPGYGITLSGGG